MAKPHDQKSTARDRFRWIQQVVRDRGLSHAAARVGIIVSDYVNDGGMAWPSQATIAGVIGVSERYVQQTLLPELVAGRHVRITAGNGRRHSNTYQLILQNPEPEFDLSTPKDRTTDRPSTNETPNHSSKNPEPQFEKGRTAVRTNHSKNHEENQLTPLASPSPLDFKKELFARGVPYLQASGLTERDARSMLGKWRRDHGDLAVLNALASAEGNAASEPIPYITRALNGATRSNGNGHAKPNRAADTLDRLANFAADEDERTRVVAQHAKHGR